MSFATESLALAQTTYQNALVAQTRQNGKKIFTAHDIDKMLKQVKYWQAEVDAETSRAAGKSSRGPIRFNL